MADCKIKVTCECDRALELIGVLSRATEASAEVPAEIRDELVIVELAPEQLFSLRVDLDGGAAGELVVRLDPSDRLLDLVAALGARDAE